MDLDLALLTKDVRSVGAELVLRFRDVLPDSVVEAAVATAAGELRGQVPQDAFGELLHQLAAHRLHEHAAALGRRMNR
ncbi:MAG TPA: hypothetical protein VNP92_12000 [Actinophytocola sp.]|nr:hypothetical protein [Actinophytocola sp.]